MKNIYGKLILIIGLCAASTAYSQSEFESRLFVEADGVMTMRLNRDSIDGQKDLSKIFADLVLNGKFEDSEYRFSCRYQSAGGHGQGSRYVVLNLPMSSGDSRFGVINLKMELSKGYGVSFSRGCSENLYEENTEAVRKMKVDLFQQKLDGKVPSLGNSRVVVEIVPSAETQGTLSAGVDYSQPLEIVLSGAKFTSDFNVVTNNGTSLACVAGGECRFLAMNVKDYVLSTGPIRQSPTQSGGKIFINADQGTLGIGGMGATNFSIMYDQEFSRVCSESEKPLRVPGFVCNASVRLVDNKPVIGQVNFSLTKNAFIVPAQGAGPAPALFAASFYQTFLIDDSEITESLNTFAPGLSTGVIIDGGFITIEKTPTSTYSFHFQN